MFAAFKLSRHRLVGRSSCQLSEDYRMPPMKKEDLKPSKARILFVFFFGLWEILWSLARCWPVGSSNLIFFAASFFFFKRQGDEKVWCCIYAICLEIHNWLVVNFDEVSEKHSDGNSRWPITGVIKWPSFFCIKQYKHMAIFWISLIIVHSAVFWVRFIRWPLPKGITILPWDHGPVHLRSLRNDAGSWQKSVLQMLVLDLRGRGDSNITTQNRCLLNEYGEDVFGLMNYYNQIWNYLNHSIIIDSIGQWNISMKHSSTIWFSISRGDVVHDSDLLRE